MKPGGSMPHSQGLSNNPYPEPNQPGSILFIIYKRDLILKKRLSNDIYTVGMTVRSKNHESRLCRESLRS